MNDPIPTGSGRSPDGSGSRASPQAPSGLGHSASIPNATPGPWVASDNHSGSEVWRIESDAPGYPNDGWIIASLSGPDAEANANLIASAPSLYEALADLMAVHDEDAGMEDFPDDDSVGRWQDEDGKSHDLPMTFGHLRRARAALARAQGEPE